MQADTRIPGTGLDVVRAGIGKRQYALRQTWLGRLPAFVILVVFTTLVLWSDPGDWPIWMAFVMGFAALSELVIWPRANRVVIHPDYVDTSQLTWGSKMRKRRKHRIRYEDVISVSGYETTGRLEIRFKLSSGLAPRIGIQEWQVDLVLRRPADVADITDAIELGRANANAAAREALPAG